MLSIFASPWFWSALGAGLSALAGLGGGGSQERRSFGSLPTTWLIDARSDAANLRETLRRLLAEPVTLRSAYAQPLPVFAGGGLPMPIGVTGRDPAFVDPSLLTLPPVIYGALPPSPWVPSGGGTRGGGTSPPGQEGGGPRIPEVPPVPEPDIPEPERIPAFAPVSDADEALLALRLLGFPVERVRA